MAIKLYHNEKIFVEEVVRATRAILLVNDTSKFCTAIFGSHSHAEQKDVTALKFIYNFCAQDFVEI